MPASLSKDEESLSKVLAAAAAAAAHTKLRRMVFYSRPPPHRKEIEISTTNYGDRKRTVTHSGENGKSIVTENPSFWSLPLSKILRLFVTENLRTSEMLKHLRIYAYVYV